MVVLMKPRNIVNIDAIYAMRRSGATLEQIAARTYRTKERIRQILIEYYGSTKHNLLSTRQLCKQLDYSRHHIMELYERNVITPAREWNAGNVHHFLWSPSTAGQITSYHNTHELCKMCGTPIPKGRWVFCSRLCSEENHKYKHKSLEAKRNHLQSIRRYRKRRKQLAKRAG